MTITEAVREVLKDRKEGLTAGQIYNEILIKDLYSFRAKLPQHVMLSQIRRHCHGLNFPSANPVKYFQVVDANGETRYSLYDESVNEEKRKDKKPKLESTNDLLPEERVMRAHREHVEQIKKQLLDSILDDRKTKRERGAFFEKLVVDLILRLGYGYGSDSGKVTGQPHDGGIDGIIYEDRLGLDKIYIQAKCYAQSRRVGVTEVQAFVGAMQNVQKGIFITSSYFTRDAVKFIEAQQSKSIKLIDGDELTEQMVKYSVGLSTVRQISIHKVDSDYFAAEQ